MSTYLQQIVNRLESFLKERDHSDLDLSTALFAKDEDVVYDTAPWTIPRSKLIEANQSGAFADLFAGGPSWIHGNLILSERNRPTITILVGAKVGNPQPSINVSYERKPLVVTE